MKRSSYLQYTAVQPLSVKPLRVWGYDRRGRFVCRVEVNGAGLAVYGGKKGTRRVADVTWEKLVARLRKTKQN
jgi:hypothetical protein